MLIWIASGRCPRRPSNLNCDEVLLTLPCEHERIKRKIFFLFSCFHLGLVVLFPSLKKDFNIIFCEVNHSQRHELWQVLLFSLFSCSFPTTRFILHINTWNSEFVVFTPSANVLSLSLPHPHISFTLRDNFFFFIRFLLITEFVSCYISALMREIERI